MRKGKEDEGRTVSTSMSQAGGALAVRRVFGEPIESRRAQARWRSLQPW
jgi:hypothetical protein